MGSQVGYSVLGVKLCARVLRGWLQQHSTTISDKALLGLYNGLVIVCQMPQTLLCVPLQVLRILRLPNEQATALCHIGSRLQA